MVLNSDYNCRVYNTKVSDILFGRKIQVNVNMVLQIGHDIL
jgi:hypothetical protein